MKRDQTVGLAVNLYPKTKAEALDIINRHKVNAHFRLHVAVSATPVVMPNPRTFRACVPLSRAEVVQFIEDSFHPAHEQQGYAMPISVATGARPARMVNGQEVEYGTPRKFIFIG